MNKTWFVKWCTKYWPYALYVIGAVAFIAAFFTFPKMTADKKIIYILALLLPLHVFEENTWPSGFHYLFNTVQKSEAPDAGPLNCLTDMISNFGAEIVMIALIIWGGNAATDILAAFFGIGESTVHTVFGIIMHKKLKSKGSKTIYGPGLFTAVFTMLPLSVYAIIRLTQIQLSASDVITGIILVFVIIAGLIRIPVKTLGKYQKQYVFTDSGYYEKYKK